MFKEYVSDKLSNFTNGMSEEMSRSYNFVNIAVGGFTNVTEETLAVEYPISCCYR